MTQTGNSKQLNLIDKSSIRKEVKRKRKKKRINKKHLKWLYMNL
jgi:hypothetical protein